LGTGPGVGEDDSPTAPGDVVPSAAPAGVFGSHIGNNVPPGITGPLQTAPPVKLPSSAGNSPPLLPPVAMPPMAIPIPAIDESPSGPAPNPSAIDLPPGCFLPSGSPPVGMPSSVGAIDLPDPTDSQLPGGQASSGTLGDLLPSLLDAGRGQGDDSAADGRSAKPAAESANSAAAATSGGGTSAAWLGGPPSALTINLGEGHRLAKNALDTIARKMDLLSIGNAQREVSRAFDLYQANRRAMFNTFGRR